MTGESTTTYDKSFFDEMEQGALLSARQVLPLVFELLTPRRVIDVGCGRGAWLRTAMHLGVEDVLGLDGDYVIPESLLIPRDRFLATDLTRPFLIPEPFDLALCLEVAEHLPSRSAKSLVAGLAAAAPAVLFSAAIPGQPGTHHVNEQFPEYWQRLFATHGYVALDAVRPCLRANPLVEPWYAQNILLYVSAGLRESLPRLRNYQPVTSPAELLPWVYGGIWRGRVTWRGPLGMLKVVAKRALAGSFRAAQ